MCGWWGHTFYETEFCSKASGVVCNFRLASRKISSQILVAQCCHLYGCQAEGITTKALVELVVGWRKTDRKLLQFALHCKVKAFTIAYGESLIAWTQIHISAHFVTQGKHNKMKPLSNINTYWNYRRKITIRERSTQRLFTELLLWLSMWWHCQYY